jgi:hypothetical protein
MSDSFITAIVEALESNLTANTAHIINFASDPHLIPSRVIIDHNIDIVITWLKKAHKTEMQPEINDVYNKMYTDSEKALNYISSEAPEVYKEMLARFSDQELVIETLVDQYNQLCRLVPELQHREQIEYDKELYDCPNDFIEANAQRLAVGAVANNWSTVQEAFMNPRKRAAY